MLFPRNRVNCIFLVFIVTVPAFLVIGLWALSQFFGGIGSIAVTAQAGGVAYMAHLGGFAAGLFMALRVRRRIGSEPDNILLRNCRRDPRSRRLW